MDDEDDDDIEIYKETKVRRISVGLKNKDESDSESDEFYEKDEERGRKEEDKIRKVKKAHTNIIAVDLGTLSESVHIFTGEAIFCTKCQGAFNIYSVIKEENNEQIWDCEFCNTKNTIMIEKEEIPDEETIDYMLDPPKTSETTDQSIIVFCIDTSGSMCSTSEVSGDYKLKKEEKSRFLPVY